MINRSSKTFFYHFGASKRQMHRKCIEEFNIASRKNYVNSAVSPTLFHHGGEWSSRVVKPKSSERGRVAQVAFVVNYFRGPSHRRQ